jgi:hypothetical protein
MVEDKGVAGELTLPSRFSNLHAWRKRLRQKVARQAAGVLPSVDALDKIMGYETALRRQQYRAMNQFGAGAADAVGRGGAAAIDSEHVGQELKTIFSKMNPS